METVRYFTPGGTEWIKIYEFLRPGKAEADGHGLQVLTGKFNPDKLSEHLLVISSQEVKNKTSM